MKFIIIILLFNLVLAQDIGQKMFDNGDSDSAILFYKRLLNNEDISNDDLIYNLASIYSSLDSLDKAEEYFSLAESDSLNPSSELKYNYGNMLYKSKNLEGSLIAFREALIKNPKDNDARKNYEFVKNEIDKTKQEKQKSQEQNEEKDDSQDKKNNNNEDQNKNNKNKDDKSNNSEEDPKKSNNNEGPTNQESSDTQQKDNDQDKEISIDQSAENILNAMKEAEKVNKKRKQTNYSNQSGKEW
jgi:Ca-activated chloride channel family protein